MTIIKENITDELVPENYENFYDFYEDNYPADVAEFLASLEEEVLLENIVKLSPAVLSEIIIFFDEDLQKEITSKLTTFKLAEILSNMYSDDAADLLGVLRVGKIKEVLKLMKENKALELKELLEYDDESAGGRMTTEFIAFYADNSVGTVLNKIKDLMIEPEMIYYIYVISRKKELLGVLSVRQLLTAHRDEQLNDIMNENVVKVDVNLDQEEVAKILSKYDLLAVPVINKHQQLVGIITVDDILDIIEEETTEDLFKMSGATSTYDIHGNFMEAVKKRIPWLFILLLGGLMSGTVIGRFEEALQSIAALAIFIPVLMDMGGNVGTQSLTIVVRGLATDELELKSFFKHLLNEFKAGIVMSLLIGGSLLLITFIWHNNIAIAVVVGFSMVTTMITAVILGTSIPFIIDYFGIDPAVAAGPFITTLVDISGLFIYFTLATILLERLV
ncbi:magnesium transporter [Halanaerobium sp. Z-7514]|uniref:Magnesium transporter MgtE n=1 Tax=Halanaerobium polyolivorans TaxID=2886943 RepID=A0AAW4X0P9_9FIRM|nr:magnesium transporter [Halanaerobium polyolivorans]MCC3145384.1 magnesium transporter [Halanaerobium polyolivorans]RQD75346.1 MAG: magnesium transporter [Halanaerobium sp. MSAO_Bac5]